MPPIDDLSRARHDLGLGRGASATSVGALSNGEPRAPRVSVIVMTYNHERYVAQALDSVVSQVGVEWELLVTEDCSTDRTRDIVRAYAARDPDRIRTFFSERNVNTPEVFARAWRAARGEFVAQLDGDDYWTSPRRLARTVAFLDAHPECTVCFHDAQIVFEDGSPPRLFNGPAQKPFSTVEDLFAHDFIASFASLTRRAALGDPPEWYASAPYYDWPLFLMAARHGLVGFLPDVMGVYRVHGAGAWSGAPEIERIEHVLGVYELTVRMFGERARRVIAPHRAGSQIKLARAYAAAGRYGSALRTLFASVRTRPANLLIRPTWAAQSLLKLVLPGVGSAVRAR